MSGNSPIQELRALRVLLVEDSVADEALILGELRRGGYQPDAIRVETADAFQSALAERTWDCVLSDYNLPAFSGIDALRLLQQSGLDLPFIVVSGAIGEETAVAAMKAGAHDYVMKDHLARLGPAIERELGDAAVRQERRRATVALQQDAKVATALGRVGQELITYLDSPELMDSLCQVTTNVLACESSHTLLLDRENQVFRYIAGHGDTPDQRESERVVSVPRRLLDGVLSRLEHDDVTGGKGSPLHVDATDPSQAGNELCMALRQGRDLIGVHVAHRRDGVEPFGPVDERIGRGIAHLASLALGHARAREDLERSNSLKSEFVATMSHELRTPLNIIVGYTDLLSDGSFGQLPTDATDALRRVDKSARDLLELINATLDLSRLEKGQVRIVCESIRVADVLREIGDDMDALGEKPTVQLVWDVPEDLAPIRTDRMKLRVILRNIIANAIKFTDEGTVNVVARVRKGGLEVAVSDTGIGIAPAVLPIIFEPFRQGESSMTRRFGGAGLGLYIVRRLLDLLGGWVTVESEVGRGSTFRVRIPNHPDVSEPTQGSTSNA